MSASNTFRGPSEFFDAVQEHFAFLHNEFAFELEAKDAVGPESWIVFATSTTRVTVHYEIGSHPWVELAQARPPKTASTVGTRYDLVFLVEQRSPSLATELSAATSGDSTPASVLRILATALRQVGRDVLLGDFQVFAELKDRALKKTRERSKHLFGAGGRRDSKV